MALPGARTAIGPQDGQAIGDRFGQLIVHHDVVVAGSFLEFSAGRGQPALQLIG